MLFPGNAAVSPQLESLSPAALRSHLASVGHCSAIIKVTGDLTDLLLGHVTWFTYTSMIRCVLGVSRQASQCF